jgi:hypothetical protein
MNLVFTVAGFDLGVEFCMDENPQAEAYAT